MQTKTNVEQLNELINPETFAFERGSDYGRGKPASSTEITTHKMTDTLDKMVRAVPPMGLAVGATMGAYLGEDSISKKKGSDHDVLTRRKEEDDEFGHDAQVQKIIRSFASVLNDLEPEGRKAALAKLHTLTITK